jgi:iron complex outermembrane recepter protein
MLTLSEAKAQAAELLDEVVVTAQRRQQSLQEVPVSIETISGQEIRAQGFKNMDQLADFSPSILIDSRVQDQDVAIRGVGTTGNNLTLEQAAPTFVDGIHFGRTSQIKSAFLDLERVEVLRGPQPVYFGQNATAGAFSLTTRKPGAAWEADVTAEVGNFGLRSVEAATGGPLTETFGVRVAGRWDETNGYLTDVVSGDDFPTGQNLAGRVIAQWTPNDRFRATWKTQFSSFDGDADGTAVIRTPEGHPGNIERSVLIDGLSDYELIPLTSSFSDGLGVRTGSQFFAAPDYIRQEDADSGNVDIRNVVCEVRLITDGICGGRENIDPWDTYVDLEFELANGLVLSSLTGFSHLDRSYSRDNSISPFLMNYQSREELYDSSSQELRVSSQLGEPIEWMAGLYWQETDLDLRSDSMRGNVRQGRRYNEAQENAEWKSLFGTVTFNFLDDKASIDVGGRYTEVDKTASVIGYGANWIFDIEPVSLGSEGVDYFAVPGGWTTEYNEVRDVPPEWHTMAPVGVTPLDASVRADEAHTGTFSDSHFNPQVTARYRPTEDWSFYARYAEAFKAGGFDTGSASLPESQEEFEFLSEEAMSWELGAKGTFYEGRARANVTLFWMEVDNLQLATANVDPDSGVAQGSTSTNAGLQRVTGVEFDLTALLMDNLTVNFSGALMDGEMVEFEGAGCTDAELAQADTGPCISEDESVALIGNDDLEGLIDRSGSEAPRTPDWVFTLRVDYSVPFGDRYKFDINGLIKSSDGYITNVEDFALDIKMNQHSDMNLSIGLADIDDQWKVSIWGKNLLEPLPSYNVEYDVFPIGIATTSLSSSHFRSYGVRFEYNYF